MCWISIETQLPEDPGPKKVGTAVDVFGICALFNVGRREADCSYQIANFGNGTRYAATLLIFPSGSKSPTGATRQHLQRAIKHESD